MKRAGVRVPGGESYVRWPLTSLRVTGVALILGAAILACGGGSESAPLSDPEGTSAEESQSQVPLAGPPVPEPGTAIAIFAGGCFWCMEPPFDAIPGVVSTTSGYTGGRLPGPTYRQVSSGTTGHLEAVQVVYRPEQVSYGELLRVFWTNIDPLDAGGQFCDRGEQYTTAIFTLGPEQESAAQRSKDQLQQAFRQLDAARSSSDTVPRRGPGDQGPIVTPIRPASAFYPAEDYHQDYYRNSPARYKFYRTACRRDARLEAVWSEVPSRALDFANDRP